MDHWTAQFLFNSLVTLLRLYLEWAEKTPHVNRAYVKQVKAADETLKEVVKKLEDKAK